MELIRVLNYNVPCLMTHIKLVPTYILRQTREAKEDWLQYQIEHNNLGN
jgi:hypothetical protein